MEQAICHPTIIFDIFSGDTSLDYVQGGISETKMVCFFGTIPFLWGNNYCSSGPHIIGNRMKNLRPKYITKRGNDTPYVLYYLLYTTCTDELYLCVHIQTGPIFIYMHVQIYCTDILYCCTELVQMYCTYHLVKC
jgi:hypothetical protein